MFFLIDGMMLDDETSLLLGDAYTPFGYAYLYVYQPNGESPIYWTTKRLLFSDSSFSAKIVSPSDAAKWLEDNNFPLTNELEKCR